MRRTRRRIWSGREVDVAIPRRRERTWRIAAPIIERRITERSLYPKSEPAERSTVQFPLVG
jgi:hypothetical protein